MHGGLHPNSNFDHLHITRSHVGKGIIYIEDDVRTMNGNTLLCLLASEKRKLLRMYMYR